MSTSTDRSKAMRIYRNNIENAALSVNGVFKVKSMRTKTANTTAQSALKKIFAEQGSVFDRIEQFESMVGKNPILTTRVEVEIQGMSHLVLDIISHIEMDEIDFNILTETYPDSPEHGNSMTAALALFSFMHFEVVKVTGIDTCNITNRISDEMGHCMA